MEQIYLDALKIAVNKKEISCSFLQRKLSIGYVTALNICIWLEEKGYVSPVDEDYKRKVLITKAEYEKIVSDNTKS